MPKESGNQAFLNRVLVNFTKFGASALAFHRQLPQSGGNMRIVVGSGSSRDLKHAELDRHLAILAQFVARVGCGVGEGRNLTLVLRSASSSPAQALIIKARDLARAGIGAKVLVAALEPEIELRRLYACLSELSPRVPARELIRWARNPRLLDAHEQATYGSSLCWWGDAMRREADKRNALCLFEDGSPASVRLGQMAFQALWSQSSVVAERRLVGPALPKPSGAYERDAETVAAVSALRPSLQGWPLIRH